MLLEEMAKELNVRVPTLREHIKKRSELNELLTKQPVIIEQKSPTGRLYKRSMSMFCITDPELFTALYNDNPENELKAVTDIYNKVYENLYDKMHELFKTKQAKIIRNFRKGYLIIQIRQTEKYFIRVCKGDWTRQIELIPPELETDSYTMIQANQKFLNYLVSIASEPVSIPESIILLPDLHKIEPEPMPEHSPEALQEIIQDNQRVNVLSRILNPLKKGLSLLRLPILQKIS